MDNTIKVIVLDKPIEDKDKETEKKEKVPKLRVTTEKWKFGETDLEYEKQLTILENIYSNNIEKMDKQNIYISEIKHKISSYKQQDRLKKMLNEDKFVRLDEVLRLLYECKLKCYYCSDIMYIVYEIVRQNKQWSLDRIDNTQGHNKGNLVISCLECNLKRRRTNKDAFLFTKNMVIIREGIDN